MLCLTHQIHNNRFFRNFQLHFGKFEVELNGQISHQCTISCHEPQCLKLSYVRHWGIFCRPGRIHWGIIMPRIHYRAIMSTTWHDIRKLFKLDTTHNSRMDSRLHGSPCEIQATYHPHRPGLHHTINWKQYHTLTYLWTRFVKLSFSRVREWRILVIGY